MFRFALKTPGLFGRTVSQNVHDADAGKIRRTERAHAELRRAERLLCLVLYAFSRNSPRVSVMLRFRLRLWVFGQRRQVAACVQVLAESRDVGVSKGSDAWIVLVVVLELQAVPGTGVPVQVSRPPGRTRICRARDEGVVWNAKRGRARRGWDQVLTVASLY